MEIILKEIEKNELKKAFKMQKECFLPIYKKYRDKNNPCKEGYVKFISRHGKPGFKMFWIISGEKKAGQIWILTKNDTAVIARLFILPRYQNCGIASKAIQLSEAKYSKYSHWGLDTIEQEKKNVHLYEKFGYIKNGNKTIINDKMTVIEFEKERINK